MISLRDFCNRNEYVVVFAAGVGFPTQGFYPAGYPDMDFLERRGLLDLDGEVSNGVWFWNREGDPRDDNFNSLYLIRAWEDEYFWSELVSRFENTRL